ncbi:PBP1A family penicillin-binding protein [Lentilactobacillus buchneri]|uniref:Penicillin-binding protein, 1A family n=2 Tax=Lentilactobacillus buchneri TaxID=1581 RepID=J9W622_LENBU|nr:PBP1A family penicillin-binding protein [Lentilactobacillus buchneri]MCC6100142.1 PBP1A family penicillin-binding protein [Lactobacillus sp.]WCJ51892.1 PBP1A family penicillin-binding protein [Lentilactobacillus sp. Egmn17]AFS00395.1 penicillin-binding protein, 1A family [Lentilactobacillus buchneri subsp. silagei CD034]KRK69035.1 penicillin-binding protein [Lentilactobacillus buchneri DSM 20057]MCT2882665.1 PBP1A family penicillin-binding protein [Lentilactobacillus buchneri]
MNKNSTNSFRKSVGTFLKRFNRFCRRFHLVKWLVVIFLSISLVTSTYLVFLAKTAHVQNLESSLSKTTEIFDVNNKKAGELYAQKGTYVHLNQVSANIPKAVLSTEDRNFYHEYGFSFKGIARAMFLLVKNKLLHRNYISGGGSTLTQQLVKNAYLSQEQTMTRKLKELFLSIQVENVYSKNEILTMYLNNAYFGNGVWGVQDAARKYFGENAVNLSVPDSAVLAGMLTSPSAFNPIDHPKAAKWRRNVVLQLMVENNKLTQAQANYYKKTPITLRDTYVRKDGYKYPYYFDAVIDEAISKYGMTESEIMNRGYRIYTNLNQAQQQAMQNNFNNNAMFPANAADGTEVQAASIGVSPTTGGVTAVVGGRGKHVFRGYNRATQITRQPGSTMKPLAVYTPALEAGYKFDSELVDKKKSYGTNHYTPKNYNNVYQGKVPMYEALAQSMNAPAVWLLNQIGVNRGYQSVKDFNIPVTKKDKNLALALGGMSGGVSPQQMAGAYTAFANGGKIVKPFYIRKIVDSTGKVVVDNTAKQEGRQIMSSSVAKQMTSMMLGVFNNGTGADAKPYGYQVAGKTGSTEADNTGSADATKDKWIIGYTPDLVVATWEGFDNTSQAHHLENLSGTGVGPLFKNEMQTMLPYTKNSSFNTKDAQSIVQGESSNDNLWDTIQKKTNQYGNQIEQKAKDLIDDAKSWFKH